MKAEKRSKWYLWTCDFDDCTNAAMTHPVVDPNGSDEVPRGWVVVPPPRFWKGSPLAFCSSEHHRQWATGVIGPMLLVSGD